MRSAKTIRLSSLGLRVLLAYVVGALLSITLAVAAAVWMVEHDVLADLELRERVETLASKLKFDANGKPVELDVSGGELDWLYESLPHETAYRLLDAQGNVALVSKAGAAFWPSESSAPQLKRDTFSFEHNGVTLHGATATVEHEGRQWYMQFATSARLMKLIQHKFALPYMGIGIGIFSAVLIVAFGLCAYITLRFALKPLHGISEAAAAISPSSLHARLRTEVVPAEISPLVDSFNRALERLDQGYRVQKEFLGNAAHELKTPLALIRAQIELMEVDGSDKDSLLSDVEYMTRQVQQLLLLAEASEAHNYEFTTVRIEGVVEETVSYLQRMAEAANVYLTISTTADDVNWKADRGALFTLLKNLLENAIQHAPAKTTVEVIVQSDALVVRDWGPGLEAGQLPLLFERFWRAEHRRDLGAGLGLSICQEIALAHGWHLIAEKADPGLRFRLTIEAGKGSPTSNA
ncbi:sensor histidine kinase [Ottowia thiooxydans]|uniref:sensor histidine kinase n=1 Tax=Ottowia thiooxydans TaxID=219182 RepID=UPI00048DA37A|nr:ATP-binding protein [Ottowia thiooxydans]